MIELAQFDGTEVALGGGGLAAILTPVVYALLRTRKEDRDRRDSARKEERAAFLGAIEAQTKQFVASLREERVELLEEVKAFRDARAADRVQTDKLTSVIQDLVVEVRLMRHGGSAHTPRSADGVPGGVG